MAKKSRRDVLRYSAAGAVTVVTAAVASQSLFVEQSVAAKKPTDFDEVYKGKKIKGKHNANGKHELHINEKKLALTSISTLFVPEDGSEPHVGVGLISALNHYDPVEFDEDKNSDGLKKLAKKVVDILGDAELSDEAAQEHRH